MFKRISNEDLMFLKLWNLLEWSYCPNAQEKNKQYLSARLVSANSQMPMSGPANMHASIATPRLTANQHTGNGRDHLRMVERPDAHIIFPSWCSSDNSLSRVIITSHAKHFIASRPFGWAVWHSCRMGDRNQEQTRGRIGPQLRLGNLRVGELLSQIRFARFV